MKTTGCLKFALGPPSVCPGIPKVLRAGDKAKAFVITSDTWRPEMREGSVASRRERHREHRQPSMSVHPSQQLCMNLHMEPVDSSRKKIQKDQSGTVTIIS